MKKCILIIILSLNLLSCNNNDNIMLDYDYVGVYAWKNIGRSDSVIVVYELYYKDREFESVQIKTLPITTECNYPTEIELKSEYIKELKRTILNNN